MTRRFLVLVMFLLLLLPIGVVVAQSLPLAPAQRFVVSSGGRSTSAHFAVTSAIGQASVGASAGARFRINGGFLFPQKKEENRLWLPVLQR